MGKQVNVQNGVLTVRTRFFYNVNNTIVMCIKGEDDRVFVERKHGEWISRRDKYGMPIYTVCSNCNVAHLDTDFPNFCPNCGSDNRER